MTVDRTVKALLSAILLVLVALLFQQSTRRESPSPAPAPLPLPAPSGIAVTPSPQPIVPPREPDPELALRQFGGALVNQELPAEIRAWAAGQVGQIRSPAAVAALITVLQDRQIELVRAAVDALADQDDPRAKEALMALRAHPDPWVSRRVGEALAEVP